MCHIGHKIRQIRQQKKWSAEYVATHLKKPITKQAFAKKERTGNFSYELVVEVADLLGCTLEDLSPRK